MSSGQPFGKVEHAYYTGTTCVSANEAAAIKNVLPGEYTGAPRVYLPTPAGTGATVYNENAFNPRDGFNFPTTTVQVDDANPVSVHIIKLTDTKYVVLSNATNAVLEGTVVDISGTVPVAGTITSLTDGDTDSWGASAIGTAGTHFAIIFRDTVGDDYVYGKICSVSGTTITLGDEKVLDGAAVGTELTAPLGYDVCEPRAGVLLFAFEDSDDDLAAVAAPYSGLVIGTLGTQNEVSASAASQITCCPLGNNQAFVGYIDDDTYLKGRAATVSATGTIGTWGTEKTIGTNVAATEIQAVYGGIANQVVLGFIDASSDAAIQALTSSATTLTAGTAVVFENGTHTDTGIAMRDTTRGFLKYDDGTRGKIVSFLRSGTGNRTITMDASADTFVETGSTGGGTNGMVYGGNNKAVIAYEDASNTIDILVGTYFENRIIDIRSATASIVYNGMIIPNFTKKETLAKV
ncbi:hypothetical protein LCGC14_1661030 [marine sediment metagenome]|uniref:Uncharacterized protein n=1 Tax=marine sediment metagenome TaxID=412755 RepID=A0A0F9HUR6_9ZZZZ